MANTLAQITADALALSPEEKVILIDQLAESIDAGEDLPISEEWQAEIKRRIQEIDDGLVETIPAEEVFAKLREKYK